MSKTSPALRFPYPYEEFADHAKALRTVRRWEHTSRFGYLGNAQTSRAHISRVVEYFSDSYEEPQEAVHKAELFLSICDYIGRNAPLFSRKDLLDQAGDDVFSVDPALLRAIHYIFSAEAGQLSIDPQKVLKLARAFKAIGPSA